MCKKLDYSDFMKSMVPKKKKCSSLKGAKTSQESEATIRESKYRSNSNARIVSNMHNKPTKRTSCRQEIKLNQTGSSNELKYYKRICVEMRKKNE